MLTKPNKIIHAVVAALLFFIGNMADAQVTSKIIGGNPADPESWPWMAGLIKKNLLDFDGQYCGASLIAKKWVLTAAHCVTEENSTTIDVIINRPRLKLFTGEASTGERLAIDRIIVHPLYNKFTLENDIALVQLRVASSFPTIALLSPDSDQDFSGKQAIALGWGALSANKNQFPTLLQQLTLPIIDNTICSRNQSGVTENMLCAGFFSEKKDTCQGDSGGPLIVFDNESNSWHQAGITSWGNGCAKTGFYGVYTRVKKYTSLISNTICSANETPEPASLTVNINNNTATASWSLSDGATGYRLDYAPYPEGQPINTIDLNDLTHFSTELASGSSFYVAITSYNALCQSSYSNIEHFVI